MTTKLICVVGVTGNQGGSVARRFVQDPRYRIRGLTRDPTSIAAQEAAALGVELVRADLDDLDSVKAAFKGANVIFSVTDYWEPFFRPDCRQKAEQAGVSCRKYAYDVEFQHGKNIVEAAASTVDTLVENGFLVSTLSHARKCSSGNYTELYHFDSKADAFPDYAQAYCPELAAKMSCIQTGFFMTSYRYMPAVWLGKQSDGSFQTTLTTHPDRVVPFLDVNADMGHFVYAVSQMPPGKAYMAAGQTCSWTEYDRIWSQTTGHPATYKQVTTDQFLAAVPDQEFAREVDDMFLYSNDPGYDGAMDLLMAADLEQAGIQCPMTTLSEFAAKADWSLIYSQ